MMPADTLVILGLVSYLLPAVLWSVYYGSTNKSSDV